MKQIILILIFSLNCYANSIENTALKDVTPTNGYKYFSGNDYSTSHNHPAMYAYGYKNQKIVVVGKGFHKEFSMQNFSKAIEAYKSLLVLNGYQPNN